MGSRLCKNAGVPGCDEGVDGWPVSAESGRVYDGWTADICCKPGKFGAREEQAIAALAC